MKIFSSDKHRFLYLALSIIILISSLFLYNKEVFDCNFWTKKTHYYLDKFVVIKNIGFSSWHNLEFEFNGRTKVRTIGDKFFLIFKHSPQILRNIIEDFFSPNVNKVYIDIKFSDYNIIRKDRNKALSKMILSNPKTVPAQIRYKGEALRAKIRLKGDLDDHWNLDYALSLRVEIKNKGTVEGFKSFSLHKPKSRQHPYDQTYQKLIRRLGLLSPKHSYVWVYVNGNSWGLMDVEEHMSKELLEKQKRKESIIVKFGDEKSWLYLRQASKVFKPYRLSDVILNTHVYSAKKYFKKSDIYRKWISYIDKERFNNSSKLYDINSYGKLLIFTALWNYGHVLAPSNLRHYFNPYTLKLEPITTDQANFLSIPGAGLFSDYNPIDKSSIFCKIVNDSVFIKSKLQYIEDVRAIMPSIQPEFDLYSSYFPLDKKKITVCFQDNLTYLDEHFDEYFSVTSVGLKNKDVEKGEFNISDEEAKGLFDHINAYHYSDGSIKIFNLLPIDLDLISISIDGETLNTKVKKIPKFLHGKYNYTLVKTEEKGFLDGEIDITTSLRGDERRFTIDYTYFPESELFNPLRSVDNNIPSFFEKRGLNSWQVSKGTWNVNKPIVLDGNLTIGKGTNITFHNNSYLIVKGSFIAIGTLDERIVLRPTKGSVWRGIYVLGMGKKSSLKSVDVINTIALNHALLELTGGVTFYKSDVKLEDVHFKNSLAEDALNIVHSNFRLKNVSIYGAASDAFDCDFSEGVVENCSFRNVGGDALDFSGSTVNIYSPQILNVNDKAVSVGEESKIILKNGIVENVGVVIAVKDGSFASVVKTTAKKIKYKYGMTYLKKDYYSGSNLKIENDERVSNCYEYLSQYGTDLFVNGNKIKETFIDVNNLYKSKMMRKNDK